MKKIFFKNIITSFLIISFLIAPILPLREVLAQPATPPLNYQTSGDFNTGSNSGGGNFGSVGGYLKGLAPAITQLPLCKEKITGTVQKVFTNFGKKRELQTQTNTTSGATNKDGKVGNKDGKNLSEDATDQAKEAINVKAPIINFQLNSIQNISKQNEKNTSELLENDTCLKSIGRLVVKMLLQKITVSTVAWIQGGFEGGPSFIENPGNFFRDIAKEEIIQFGLEIDDPDNFPFGKNWMRTQAQLFNRRFADNAKYSLNELIQATNPEYDGYTFSLDFAMGGWDAWSAMVEVPANNAFGFDVIATAELSRRLEGTSNSRAEQKREELAQGLGFLGDERCIEPKGLTREQHNRAMELGQKEMKSEIVENIDTTTGITGNRTYRVVNKPTGRIVGACNGGWEYVTPGKLIAEAATESINYTKDSLLSAEDLNDAIAAVLDALMSQFSSQIIGKGFANISNTGADGQFVLNNAAYGAEGYTSTRVDSDYYSSQQSDWLRRNPNFNIRTDLTQSFIDAQRTYVEKLKNYNDELEELIRMTYQLDYCIPGPTVDWKERAEQELYEIAKNIPSTPGGPIDLVRGILTIMKAINLSFDFKPVGVGVGLSLNLGGLTEGILAVLGNGMPEDVMTRYFYTSNLTLFSGIKVAPSNQISSRGDVINILDGIINSYEDAIKRTFNKNVMPSITKVAYGEYLKVPGYREILEENEAEITTKNSAISQLTELKRAIEAIDPGSTSSSILDEPDFPIPQEYLSKFARLSGSFIDGDDIADIEKLAKQARDQRLYIKSDLLEGRYGCETEMFNGSILDPKTPLRNRLEQETNRRLYPKDLFIPYDGKAYGQNVDADPICALGEVVIDGECMTEPSEPVICIAPQVFVNNRCVDLSTISTTDCIYNGTEENPDDPIFDACIENTANELSGVINNISNGGDGTGGGTTSSTQIILVGVGGNGSWSKTSSGLGTWTGITTSSATGNPPAISGSWIGPDGQGGNWSTLTPAGGVLSGLNSLNSNQGTWVGSYTLAAGLGGDVNTDFVYNPTTGTYTTNTTQINSETEGFLIHGYVVSFRIKPSDAVENQRIIIPKSILDVNKSCALLTFGERADTAAKRALNKQKRACKKDENPAECRRQADLDYVQMQVGIREGESELGKMCDFRTKPRDSILDFERIMNIY